MQQSNYKFHIEGLRGISVLLVMLYHFGIDDIPGGYVGVDAFFVISGYLITRNILRDCESGNFDLKTFYYRRIRRLGPCLMATVFLSLVIGSVLLSPNHFAHLGKSAFYSLLSVVNFFYWSEAGYFDTSSLYKPLLHLWSLSVEEQFYFIWPLLCVFVFKIKKDRFLFFIFLGLCILSLLASQWILSVDSSASYFLVPFRAFELLIGALCVFSRHQHFSAFSKLALGLLGLALLFVSAFLFDSNTPFPGFNALAPSLGTALLILFGVTNGINQILCSRIFTTIGKMSYSLYLVHWPIVVFYSYWHSESLAATDSLILFASTMLVGATMYYQVENRFRHSLKEPPNRYSPRTFITYAAISFSVLGAAGISIYYADGLERRVPSSEINQKTSISTWRKNTCNYYRRDTYTETCHYFGKPKFEKTLLIIGDSHAQHLLPGLVDIADRNGLAIKLHTHSGCPPLFGMYRTFTALADGGPVKEQSCKQTVEGWRQKISTEEVDAALLSARWMSLFESNVYGDTILRRDYLSTGSNTPLNEETSRKLFQVGLTSTISDISAQNIPVILFNQIPLPGRNIQDCQDVPRVLFSHERLKKRCSASVSRDTALSRLAYMRDTFKSRSVSEKVISIDLTDILCPKDKPTCLTTLDSTPIYHDDNHLNAFGSRKLAPLYEKQLLNVLK